MEQSRTLKIAVVDDEIADIYSLVLRSLGYPAPSIFNSGTALVRALMADHMYFDVILMDYRMPEMDGIEAAKIVKRYRKNTQIIITSGYDFVKEKAHQIGAPFLQKPFSREQLAQVLART
ncbi:MAG: response regulator [Nitrososphaerales archaeon]